MNSRLYRSVDDRILAGVCGGMAEAYDLDPALVRLVWTLLIVFTGGAFLVVYIVMALVVPLRPFNWPATAGATTAAVASPASTGEPGSAAADPVSTGPAGAAGNTGWQPADRWSYGRRRHRSDRSGALVVGALLVIVGGYLLVQQFFPLVDIGRFWPLIIVSLGLALLVAAFGRRSQ
jgi:phage shock protein C